LSRKKDVRRGTKDSFLTGKKYEGARLDCGGYFEDSSHKRVGNSLRPAGQKRERDVEVGGNNSTNTGLKKNRYYKLTTEELARQGSSCEVTLWFGSSILKRRRIKLREI